MLVSWFLAEASPVTIAGGPLLLMSICSETGNLDSRAPDVSSCFGSFKIFDLPSARAKLITDSSDYLVSPVTGTGFLFIES